MRLLIIIGLLGIHTLSWGQSFRYLDSLSYAQYLAGEAKPLIQTIKVGERKGFNSYYWQMRKGLAYQWLGQPRRAEMAFLQALKMAPSSQDAKTLTGQQYFTQQSWLRYWQWQHKYPDAVAATDLPGVWGQVFAEGGQKWISAGHPFLGNTSFASLGLSHRVGWSILQQWTFQYLDVLWDYEDANGQRQRPHVRQYQWGGRTQWAIGRRDGIQGAFQIAQVNLPDSLPAYDGMVQLHWQHRWASVDSRLGLGMARYQDTVAYQLQLGGTWYPAYTNRWRLTLLALPQWHQQSWMIGGYGMVEWEAKTTYISLMAGWGDRPRYIDPEGLLLYNHMGQIVFNARVLVRQQLTRHWQLYIGYSWEKKQDFNASYEQHTPFLGITYNF